MNVYKSDSLLVRSIFEDPFFLTWRTDNSVLHLFLDSLDECLIRIDTLAAFLADELARCPIERLYLRVACRTAVWPTLLETRLMQLWGEDAVGVYELAPLRRRDVAEAATARGIDPSRFLAEVDRREAAALASKPVTLRFLLAAYQRNCAFPPSQAELYRQGCECLCEETSDSRRAAQLIGTLTAHQRLQIAARIAALFVFCGRPNIWTGIAVEAPEGDLPLADLLGGVEPIDEQPLKITGAAVREVLDTGLFSARGPEQLGFAHQTYAEFLAAWYLYIRGMEITQMPSLITHSGDEAGRIVPQLQEATAWLASLVPALYDRIAESDPQVLLNSDVATMSPEACERLVGSLLRLFDAGILIDRRWDLRAKYRKLAHPHLQAQLEPFIRDSTKNTIVRRVAIDIAEACQLRALQGLLADIVLEPSENQHIRAEAAAALVRIADVQTLRRLLPCVTGAAGDDPQDELKGFALRALWPSQLTVEDVFAALTPPKDPSLLGSYKSFLKAALCWDARLATALAEKVRDSSLTAESLGDLLESLLDHGSSEARTFAVSLVSSPIPTEAPARTRVIVVATMLLVHAENTGWEAIWRAIQADSEFGREVITAVADRHDQQHAAMMTQQLSEERIGDLYLWLVQQYPPSEDPQHKGVHFVGPREGVAHFRDAVLQQLQYRGTLAACRTMERLAMALPELSWLRWATVEARTHTLRQTWVPPEPNVLLKMTQNRDLRLVESGEQLLAGVIESLRRLEQELQGETPAAPDLWNKLGDSFRPKDENELSDYVVLNAALR